MRGKNKMEHTGKRALVLAGGGAKGSYQIGVWRALQELDWTPDIITGASVGTLNGCLFNDELDFDRDWLADARRYYGNIVGKYGPQVQAALKKLGGQYEETRAFTLPDGSARGLVFCKKISQTPTVYPRNGGKIAKKPL